ncbi:FKBP-type peptidyl-prolyl cis-trans isomerase [Polymorphobacter fuscus]|uniref:Peptidyl-prolyl cis-trans isomerase n=1 Tax=Sandarakinorhabdus fusca TaxID=1439888 RepID=A0A7C9KXU4_9SPHN|nr:FKBP-type peptidyl-prolyl cis-trans isomerase [Polymorphobacter fuscus]KAB7646535.1 FKBP-type peptidyl-prolyl cis-trans isomerase [Polymorphobacter fuscus]MQT17782.1 FKBP-type peptidyl-prolyl cis-trans isomerase [Polymorphobacter fuscus]NJC09670.1 FKBP-type peptidyl-prolyl cis-trans isomerase FkpA/FKBP-type peptidyl-prolyl cis-trans isomerase FklB [Polymorphobacter fuscus]
MATATPETAPGGGVTKWLVAAVVLLAIVVGLVWAGTQSQVAAVRTEDMKYLADNGKKPGVMTTPSGLQYQVIRQGTGPKPAATDTVLVHYEGRLVDAAHTVFDSSYQRGQPAAFPLDKVIPGWTEGVQLMPAGSKFRFVVPPALGYGAAGAGGVIPPGAVLEFDVELLAVKPS